MHQKIVFLILGCIAGWSTVRANTTHPDGVSYHSITVGMLHSCVIKDSWLSGVGKQAVLCWGNNESGELGTIAGDPNSEYQQVSPVAVEGLSDVVTQVSAGDNFTCALLVTGEIQCWGNGFNGDLGYDAPSVPNPWPENGTTATPVTIPGFGPNHPAIQISLGASFACALTSVGEVYCWGDNRDYELANTLQFAYGYSTKPLPIKLPYWAESVSTGDTFACALLSDPTKFEIIAHTVYCWGNDNRKQLGDGKMTKEDPQSIPVEVVGMQAFLPMTISAGDTGVCALNNAGEERCWGDDSNGEIGDNKATDVNQEAIIPAIVQMAPVSLMATGFSREGNCSVYGGAGAGLWCWGWGANNAAVPVRQPVFDSSNGVQLSVPGSPSEVAKGFFNTCAIASYQLKGNQQENVWCWGRYTGSAQPKRIL